MAGRYKILEELGSGGAGAVFKAYDTQLDRYVAIKRLMTNEEAARQDAQSGGLKHEAASLATLQHPNVVAVFDLGTDEEGVFMVMELVEGETLADWVQTTPMTLEDFQELAKQSLEALMGAHSQSILHRDLKPENIKLKRLPSGRRQVKVLDFGLARMSYGAKKMTEDQRGTVAGSIHYMAPEQFQRKPIDGRTDLYSLGCVFYYVLSGRRPYNGANSSEVMEAHLQHLLHPLKRMAGHVPDPVCEWVMWLINADPVHRPASAQQALGLLNDIIAAGWFGRESEAVPIAHDIPAAEQSNRPATSSQRLAPGTSSQRLAPGTSSQRLAPGTLSQRLAASPPNRASSNVPRAGSSAVTPRAATSAQPAAEVAAPSASVPVWVWPVAAAIVGLLVWVFWPKQAAPPVIAAVQAPSLLPVPGDDFLQKGAVFHYRAGVKAEAWTSSGSPAKDARANDLVLAWHDLASSGGDSSLLSADRLPSSCPKLIVEKPQALKGPLPMLRFDFGHSMMHHLSLNDPRVRDYPFGDLTKQPLNDPSKAKGVTVMMLLRPRITNAPVLCLRLANETNDTVLQMHAHASNDWKMKLKTRSTIKELKVTGRNAKHFTVVGMTWNTQSNKALMSVRSEDGNKGRAEMDAPKDVFLPLNQIRIANFSSDRSKPVPPEEQFSGDVAEIAVWPYAMDWNERSAQEMKFMRHYYNTPGSQF
ncbi:MAG: serine/threonine protein kinase [Roseimicrobium sp.]